MVIGASVIGLCPIAGQGRPALRPGRGLRPSAGCIGRTDFRYDLCVARAAQKNEIGRTGGWSRSAYFFGGKFHRTPLAGRCSVGIVGCWLALDRSVFMIAPRFAHNHGQLDTIFGPFARNLTTGLEIGNVK